MEKILQSLNRGFFYSAKWAVHYLFLYLKKDKNSLNKKNG